MQERGRKVCMVGDSGNDVEALARSDFSIAICSQYGDKNTQAKAGAVIRPNSLSTIPKAFLLAKQTVNNIKQNLAISMVYNFLALITFSGLLAYFGIYLNPAFAAAAMIVQTALILLNVERFRHQSVPSPRKIDVRRPPDDRHKPNSPFKPLLETTQQPREACELETFSFSYFAKVLTNFAAHPVQPPSSSRLNLNSAVDICCERHKPFIIR